MENRRLRMIIDSNTLNGDDASGMGKSKIVHAYEEKFESMQSEIKNLEQMIDNRDQENEILQSQLEEARSEIDIKYKDRITINSIQSSKKVLEERLNILEEEHQRRDMNQSGLSEKCLLLEQEVVSLRNKMSSMAGEASQVEGLNIQVQDLESNLVLYKDMVQERENALNNCKTQIEKITELNSHIT